LKLSDEHLGGAVGLVALVGLPVVVVTSGMPAKILLLFSLQTFNDVLKTTNF
jgi:hypothetical protein